jgi:uncharacterized protein
MTTPATGGAPAWRPMGAGGIVCRGPLDAEPRRPDPWRVGPTHFIYLIHPPRPTFVQDATPEEMEVMGRHFAYLAGLAERGKVLLAGPCLDEGGFGVCIFKTSDAGEARGFASGDPAVASGLMRLELHPVRLSFLPA